MKKHLMLISKYWNTFFIDLSICGLVKLFFLMHLDFIKFLFQRITYETNDYSIWFIVAIGLGYFLFCREYGDGKTMGEKITKFSYTIRAPLKTPQSKFPVFKAGTSRANLKSR